MKNYIIPLLALFSLIFTACNKKQISSDSINVEKIEDNKKITDSTELIELTEKWNNLTVKQGFDPLEKMYANQVKIYGYSISKEQAIANKKDFISKYPDFNQSITGDINIEKIDDNSYKSIFPKRTNYNKKTYDVEGYLIFEKINGIWKIITESDDMTDRNTTPSNKNNKKINCADLVFEILQSSPRYKELTNGVQQRIEKNGGDSFGVALEGSPSPKEDHVAESENYEFKVYENYPDRQVVIARFEFDSYKLVLYEYDAVNDELKKIRCSENLINKFSQKCAE